MSRIIKLLQGLLKDQCISDDCYQAEAKAILDHMTEALPKPDPTWKDDHISGTVQWNMLTHFHLNRYGPSEAETEARHEDEIAHLNSVTSMIDMAFEKYMGCGVSIEQSDNSIEYSQDPNFAELLQCVECKARCGESHRDDCANNPDGSPMFVTEEQCKKEKSNGD